MDPARWGARDAPNSRDGLRVCAARALGSLRERASRAGGRWESNWFGASLGANDFDRDTMESFEPDIIGHK